ncbi:MAG: hypothetical protein WC944_04670 [Candidatus Cloacimonadaceae bacterium]
MKLYHPLSHGLWSLIALAVLLSAGVLNANEILSELKMQALSELLATQDLNLNHTEFYRDWDPYTKGKTAWHMNILQKGLGAKGQIEELRDLMATKDWDAMLRHYAYVAWELDPAIPPATALDFKNPKVLFRHVEAAYDRISKDLDLSFAQLSDSQADSLSAFLYLLMAESENEEQDRKFLQENKLLYLEKIDIQDFIPLLGKLDFAYLAKAAMEMRALYTQISQYRPLNKRSTLYKSKYGLMIIGSKEADHYSPESIKALQDMPVCLLIEPAGNDIYELPLSTGREHPFLLHIDHHGDDVYRCQQPCFFAFRGLMLSGDLQGDDIYHLGDFSHAAVLGVQMHTDSSGDAVYRSGLFAQGAGIAGLGLLIDEEGNDSYSAHACAQAFGSTYGAGILADYAGADTYYLGGKYLHAPLMPNDYRTMGQGMGYGPRPDLAGGLGLIYDAAGNDKYLGGVYAQGVGYWYSTGVLIDEGGNDVYNAIYYPQGSGIHMASGVLYDHEGDDAYYSRHGPGQGAGHDWSFGLFIDAAGNDAYSIEGGNGLGLTNSLGVFVDKSGNDRYERQNQQSYGSANFVRKTGGIGLFLDAGGEDSYPQGDMENNSVWSKGKYGMGQDTELYDVPEQEKEETLTQDPPPAADAPIREIFAAASEWEVGCSVQRVRTARQILNDRADEAAPYILEHKLADSSGLEYRALEAFTKANAGFSDLLLTYASDADSLKAKTAISLLAGEKDLRLLPYIQEHLGAKRYIPACISALGALDDPGSLQLLTDHQYQDNERLRFLVVRSLSMHSSEEAQTALESFYSDESFLIQALIRNLPKEKL